MILNEHDLSDLKMARRYLEHPGLTARITNFVGKPLEFGLKQLPAKWNEKIGEVTQASLMKGLEFALVTMDKKEQGKSKDWMHKLAVTTTGSVGGFVGLISLPVELPLSTIIILRSIADIARSEGHDLNNLTVRLECLQVLAFGGNREPGEQPDQNYWATRLFLAQQLSKAASYLAEKGFADKSAPPLVRFIASVASRFSSVVTEEAVAKAIPTVSAVAGGAINYLFMNHFQDMARGHFTVRRLERSYGEEEVRQAYLNLHV